MLRIALAAACRVARVQCVQKSLIPAMPPLRGQFSTATFTAMNCQSSKFNLQPNMLSTNPAILRLSNNLIQCQQTRSVTKFSLKNGKRKTVKAVLKRFMRLDWGGWIRTRCGRHKKMWKKSGALRNRLRQHVLVNGTQSWLLDKMVTKYWRQPKYYLNDPYRPYHSRENFFATRKNPIKY